MRHPLVRTCAGTPHLRRFATALAALALVTPAATPAAEAATDGASGSPLTALVGAVADAPGSYLVVLRGAPLATYDGSTPGFGRTAPRRGERFDANRPAVRAYETHLLRQQDDLLDQLGSPEVLYHYTAALNGFAAKLTSEQVSSLREHSDVLAIERSRFEHLAGGRSTDNLRLGGHRGFWQRIGGPAHAGKGVVIGVVDSGVWPENPSFAGVPVDRATLLDSYPGFTGTCEPGERWTRELCNAKVVSARFFLAGFGANRLAASDFASPRDGSGHGSHTAAIAAGNAGVDVSISRQDFGHVAGVAPAAAVAIYKACWAAPNPDDDGCATPDTAKAVDQAVRDGVDVLNYSVTGHDDTLTDVLELAFLNAAAAGVFVSAAAGDEGPGMGTVSHSAPWVTTVGASSTGRFQGAVVLGNGRSVPGSMVSNKSIRDAPLVYAGDVAARKALASRAAHCFPGTLDASRIEGAIVICTRGVNGRVTKSQTVSQSGGVGMVLVNNAFGSTEADLHAVPTVHVTKAHGAAIVRYAERARRPTATLDASGGTAEAPSVADFSSRGPASVAHGDVLKPDLAAPGVSVLAAVAPPSNFGHLWDIYSGTSMAAPEVSGLAADVRAKRPQWTPAMTKSALMTTARPMADSSPLEQGAGEVAAGPSLLEPGLVYDAGLSDWLGYLRGSQDPAAAAVSGDAVEKVDSIDLNSASIAVGSLVGEQTVTRTVTNVGTATETYTARIDGLRGVAVSVSRPSITVRPGQSVAFDVTFSARKSARYQRFSAGTLTWRGSLGHQVRSPIVVRPELVRAPSELSADASQRGLRFTPRAGVTGTVTTTATDLVGAQPTGFVLSTGNFDPTAPETSASTKQQTFDVPDNTAFARFDVHTASPGDDLDLFVYRDGALVAQASDNAGDEIVTLADPPPGRYTVYVNAASATGDVTLGALTGWVVLDGADPAAADEVSRPVTVGPPHQVTGGRTFGVDVRWHDLDPSRRWLTVISYDDSDHNTFVTVS